MHERSADSDVALVLLRDILKRRPDLKLVLMSATLDSAKFSAYFNGMAVAVLDGEESGKKSRFLPLTLWATVAICRGPNGHCSWIYASRD